MSRNSIERTIHMSNKEIRIKTDAGTLLIYANEKDQNAGIMLIPKGCENEPDNEIDIAYVECIDEKGQNVYTPNHGMLKVVQGRIYENVHDTNCTHEFKIDSEDAAKSITTSGQPDSHKL